MSQSILLEQHCPVIYKGQKAIELLQNNETLTDEQLIRCFDNGAVWLQQAGKPQRIHDPQTPVTPGDRVHLYCNQTTLAPCPFKPALIHDFGDFSIWNKPSGMLSQGSKWGDHWALYRWVQQNHWPQRDCLISHRLDRFTNGLMIVAHSDDANKKFHRLFEERLIHKTYRAIVNGSMNPGEKITLDSPVDGKKASTRLEVLQQHPRDALSLLELKPETGRKHQIRIHLAESGHPVINDRQYASPPFSGDLMLQAGGLRFNHPIDNSVVDITLPTEALLSFESI